MDLFKISDEIYALSDLQSDHLFKKIPPEKIQYYISSALKIGRTVAETSKTLYKDFELRKNCKERKIKINIIDKEYRVGKIRFRAEILLKLRHINIMRESIIQLHECIGDKLTFDELVDIHIAHELFHLIEHDKNVKTNQLLDKIRIFKVGVFTKHSTIVKTSEIAAHAYCKELLNLDFHPKALDYQYMLNNNTITENKLIDFFDHLQKLLNL